MSIAWKVQAVLSGVSSSLKGGLIMSDATVRAARYRNFACLGLIPRDANQTIADEVLAYAFAAMGFYAQFQSGFRVPAPWNLIFWPLEVAEYYIRWSITEKKH